jgi:hypothetical protein
MTANAETAKARPPRAPGIPAIKVKAVVGRNLNATALTSDLTTISFTEADVRNYLGANSIMGIESDPSKSGINKIQFIPVKAVNAILNDNNTGLPLEKVVCFVTMTGNFKAPGATDTFSKSYMHL